MDPLFAPSTDVPSDGTFPVFSRPLLFALTAPDAEGSGAFKFLPREAVSGVPAQTLIGPSWSSEIVVMQLKGNNDRT